jgi:methylmalonic aciduria homocystinuria type C protein
MERAIAQLAARGFDLAHAFDLAVAADDAAFAPIAAGAARRVGVLVGNTRALWPRFVAALRDDHELATALHPIDLYTERAFAEAFPDTPVVFAHRRYGAARQFVPMQRLAELAGLAARAPTGLCVHRRYGPWFALRGVVALTGDPPATSATRLPCPKDLCAATCMPALERAMAAPPDDRAWEAWLAVRDACSVGRDYRYSDDQIHYHYTKDRSRLR